MFQKGIFIPLVILIFQTFIITSRYDIKAQERRRLLLHVLETSVTFFKYLKQKAIYDGKMWKKISKHATARASCWLKGLFPQGFVILFLFQNRMNITAFFLVLFILSKCLNIKEAKTEKLISGNSFFTEHVDKIKKPFKG